MTSLLFFGFLATLEQSGGRIPDTESVKVMFSVITTFYLTKTKNRTKKSVITLSHYCFELRYVFDRKRQLFAKNADISKIKGT